MRVNLDNIAILLHRPSSPENIGAAARAACNMGIKQLIVVAPRNCDLTRILKMATHFAADVVEEMERFEDLETAIAPFQYVVGATARIGRKRPVVSGPRKLAQDLVAISQENRIALVFGPENWGLTNAELRLCHAAVTIPTAEFTSMNLAQAVMIICYEVFLASREETGTALRRLATHKELEGMYQQLKQTLLDIDFVNPENPEYWMQRMRRFLSRTGLHARDADMIRGLCRQIEWYGSRGKSKADTGERGD